MRKDPKKKNSGIIFTILKDTVSHARLLSCSLLLVILGSIVFALLIVEAETALGLASKIANIKNKEKINENTFAFFIKITSVVFCIYIILIC